MREKDEIGSWAQRRVRVPEAMASMAAMAWSPVGNLGTVGVARSSLSSRSSFESGLPRACREGKKAEHERGKALAVALLGAPLGVYAASQRLRSSGAQRVSARGYTVRCHASAEAKGVAVDADEDEAYRAAAWLPVQSSRRSSVCVYCYVGSIFSFTRLSVEPRRHRESASLGSTSLQSAEAPPDRLERRLLSYPCRSCTSWRPSGSCRSTALGRSFEGSACLQQWFW